MRGVMVGYQDHRTLGVLRPNCGDQVGRDRLRKRRTQTTPARRQLISGRPRSERSQRSRGQATPPNPPPPGPPPPRRSKAKWPPERVMAALLLDPDLADALVRQPLRKPFSSGAFAGGGRLAAQPAELIEKCPT